MLFEIAGNSLDNYIATDVLESPGFGLICGELTTETLDCWVDIEPFEPRTTNAILEDWMGYRIEPDSNLRAFVSKHTKNKKAWHVDDQLLVDPILFCDHFKSLAFPERLYLNGLLQGDLHGGNILIHTRDPKNNPYWLIDFGLSRLGPAGFDQAYLEVARIIYCLDEEDPRLLINVLRVLDKEQSDYLEPSGTKALKEYLIEIRTAVENWINQSGRTDVVSRQFLLARIAAGLNWANKPLDENSRVLALYYASWAAYEYIRKYHDKDGLDFWDAPIDQPDLPKKQSEPDIWENLWTETKGFGDPSYRYVLIAGGLPDAEELASLGKIPWAAVVDLDPYSDENGLYAKCSEVLGQLRKVHVFSELETEFDSNRSTPWVLSCGWQLMREEPTDFLRWKYDRLPLLRRFFEKISQQSSPSPIVAIVLPGKSLDEDAPMQRVSYVCDALLESTGGQAKILLMDDVEFTQQIEHSCIPYGTGPFIKKISATFGATAGRTSPWIPMKDETAPEVEIGDNIPSAMKELELESLRALEENCHVLHSKILDTVSTNEGNEFWRGRLPTWFDLHAGLDIVRDVHTPLMVELATRLAKYQNHTVLLEHPPGTGGTTVAYRAAWELRSKSPVVILHSWSERLGSRLARLYADTQLPVLLVADSADLPETAREDLYRDLQTRNVSIVLLYTRHSFRQTGKISLPMQMSNKEAARFCSSFSELTSSPTRVKYLEEITTTKSMKRYRTPFYYGLVTFEREFNGVNEFVKNHLRGLKGQAKDVVQYMALLTIFSQSWLNEVLVRRLMKVSDTTELELSDLFGPAERLMTSSRGCVRIMHQLVAEEILVHLTGSQRINDWKQDLFSIATNFIEDIAEISDADSVPIEHLLRQLFTERQGKGVDDADDRQDFSRLIEEMDNFNKRHGNEVLKKLVECFPNGAHFFNHLGRHQAYRMQDEDLDKAEEYLERAVLLSEHDFLHHHTLGLIRRLRVKQSFRCFENDGEFLNICKPHFERATISFERTRSIKRENVYGYITEIQMILEVANELKRLSKVESIAELSDKSADWIRENIGTANVLLEETRQLYGTLDQNDSYLGKCDADLAGLYHNLDEAIRIWEIAIERDPSSSTGRRELAHAYVKRRAGSFRSANIDELTRIKELVESNLRSNTRKPEDFRIWFEAYRNLPSFDVNAAIANLKVWGARSDNWRPSFYEYALSFYLWFSGRTNSIADMENALDDSKLRFFGRRNQSVLWFAKSPDYCPFAASTDLGEWDRQKRFWDQTQPLQRVNGIIERYDGPQAGVIRIEKKCSVFFVPGTSFTEDSVNDPVSFFLGLSPSGGLRGWSVEPGSEGISREMTAVVKRPMVWAAKSPTTLNVATSSVSNHQKEKVLTFVKDLVTVSSSPTTSLTIGELESRAKSVFGSMVSDVSSMSGTFRNLLEKTGAYRFEIQDSNTLVALRSSPSKKTRSFEKTTTSKLAIGSVVHTEPERGAWGFIFDDENQRYHFRSADTVGTKKASIGNVVEFTAGQNASGGTAKNIRILHADELRKRVCGMAIGAISSSGGTIAVTTLFASILDGLHAQKSHLYAQADVGNIFELLNGVPGLQISGERPNQLFTIGGDSIPFDYIPSPDCDELDEASSSQPVCSTGTVYFWNESYGKVMDSDGKEYFFALRNLKSPEQAHLIDKGVSVTFVPATGSGQRIHQILDVLN